MEGRWISPQGFRGLTTWDVGPVLKGWERRPEVVDGWVYVKGPERLPARTVVGAKGQVVLYAREVPKGRVIISTCHDQPVTPGWQVRLGKGFRVWAGVNIAAPVRPRFLPIPCGVAPDGSTETEGSFVERALAEGAWPQRGSGVLACWDDHDRAARVRLTAQVRGWARVEDRLPTRAYVQALRESRWVLSPAGYGWDCYRTWEALACGAWVVVARTPLSPSIYEGLPVLIVDTWRDLTPALLRETAQQWQNRTWDWERLTMPYWETRIRRAAW